MRINNNLMAMNTHRMLGINNDKTAKSVEKLSSGYRINRAGDDAAGLAISEKMRAQIKGLDQASRNSQDAISLVQTAEGALNESQAILQRMRELSVQSATDTNVNVDRDAIQSEVNELAGELTRISETTEFNTQNLLGGDFEGTFHIGANEGQNIDLTISEMSAEALQVSGSGEGKATYAIDGTGVTLNGADITASALVEGEQTLSVVEVDNVTIGDAAGTIANYGLANSSGEIVAVSQDGEAFEILSEATNVEDLSAADVSHANDSIDFADPVISGAVTLSATSGGAITDIEATASIDVEGISTGDYDVVAVDSTNFGDYFTDGGADGTIDIGGGTNPLAVADITNVMVDSDGNVAAVEFATGGTNTDANEFFGVEGLDFVVDDGTAANRIDAIIDADEVAAFTAAGSLSGESVSIKADGGIDISTQETASAAITTINDALESVSDERSKLGSVQNRLEHTIKNLDTTSENLQASESRIRDVDMAAEMMEFTKNNILQQAAQSMLAQANNQPQGVLQLLR